ncbi:hypothetical protein BWI97_25530 [Siphonobacter sp. BAB-5405]|uniref:nucleotidyl transferase AbiEii/AbiGii toxin family protein n=1 Tax=Siphonobacter sp. BAB-5405 TaxID=1864825 RepID=UPI000C7F804B|nr:nucleotidyl transferase AbiEii/AbiGii toxin family protein [Siphonobacter sp. BAB-5405]PMD87991.1 hypothetical protein BWI97_25530 [Siphonobacter sp. BAB-5405]
MSHHQNVTRIKAVHQALEELAGEVVFVGGATVSLYTDRPAEEIRPTEDIDILIELAYYNEYAAVEEKLRKKGFANDTESGVICRYKVQGIIVDVMPTSEAILGFSNRWYSDGFKLAMPVALDERITIQIFNPPYFLATKLEAFKGRGNGDGRLSTDFEDIVYVLNNRSTIWSELQLTQDLIHEYLKEEFTRLLGNRYLDEWISAHIEYAERNRVSLIIRSMEDFVNNKT